MQASGIGDALGRARLPAKQRRQRLLIGSHIDTVVEAGMFDGPFGVIAGILAAEHSPRRDVSCRSVSMSWPSATKKACAIRRRWRRRAPARGTSISRRLNLSTPKV